MKPTSNYTNVALKVGVMGIGSYVVWYFAGPLAGELGRSLFELQYKFLYGTPSLLSWDYWFSYLPLRGHVSYYAYKYGDVVCATVSAPFFYKLSDMIRCCFRGKQHDLPIDMDDTTEIEAPSEALNSKLAQVCQEMGQLSLSGHEPVIQTELHVERRCQIARGLHAEDKLYLKQGIEGASSADDQVQRNTMAHH
jgi:hypothetical protein